MSEDTSLRSIRLDKLKALRELGHDPFAQEKFVSSGTAESLVEHFEEEKSVQLAGRITAMRTMSKKTTFIDLNDGTGRIQVFLSLDNLGEAEYPMVELLDMGDHLGVEGQLFLTKTGEKSIRATKITPLSKCLQTLPLGKEKDGQQWYGLTDTEQRYRHRHLDLICNPTAREMLIRRCKVVSAVRRFLDSKGYLEVETPLLQIEAGGAAARPFLTHYNWFDIEVKLRISLELYLKRIICGDIPKVYEVGRVFRNEGVSNRHNPEFTLLEFYEAYANLEDMMDIVEEMFRSVSEEVFGTAVAVVPQEDGSTLEFDFSQPWKRIDMMTEIERLSGIAASELQDFESGKRAMERVGLDSSKERNLGGIIEKLLEKFVEPTLIQPAFVIGYPIETSPLAKKDPNRPGFTRRFEGYIGGREVCNAFSEINDPIDQRERFEQQLAESAKGDEEAHPMDEDFIFALESGMPPTGGCGIGLDRMALVLTGAHAIREVLLFPMMKPE